MVTSPGLGGDPNTGAHVPILARIKTFLASPQGRKLTEQGKRMAADPQRRRQAMNMLKKLRGGRTR